MLRNISTRGSEALPTAPGARAKCALGRTLRAALTGAVLLGTRMAVAADAPAASAVATGGLDGGDLASAVVRMVLGLAVVLALLGAAAWVSRRFRLGGAAAGGLIQVTGGLSLGARERVVLLRVGDEQVLVGVSPSGMRTLHVLSRGSKSEFANLMDGRT